MLTSVSALCLLRSGGSPPLTVPLAVRAAIHLFGDLQEGEVVTVSACMEGDRELTQVEVPRCVVGGGHLRSRMCWYGRDLLCLLCSGESRLSVWAAGSVFWDLQVGAVVTVSECIVKGGRELTQVEVPWCVVGGDHLRSRLCWYGRSRSLSPTL